MIPSDTTGIGAYAFEGCTGLTQVTFKTETPDDTQDPMLGTIDKHAFYGCTGLKGIFIPYSVTYIGEEAFAGCSNLEQIGVAPSNERYLSEVNGQKFNAIIDRNGQYTLYSDDDDDDDMTLTGFKLIAGCNNTVIPSGLKCIGKSAFYQCKGITGAVIPEGVKLIEEGAFRECSNLKEVTFPETSLTQFNWNVFRECTSLEKVTIPDSVKRLGNYMFEDCKALMEADLPAVDLSTTEGLFIGCTSLEFFKYKSGMTDLGRRMFEGCTGLKYLVFPLTMLDVGYSSFYDCNSLKDIYYEGTREQWDTNMFTSLDYDDTLTIYSSTEPSHKVKIHLSSTGPAPHVHEYGDNWKSDAENHWHECACGDKTDTAAHTFEWIADKAATTTETGLKHEECTVCDYKRNENTVIDKFAPAPVPVETRYARALIGEDTVVYNGKVRTDIVSAYDTRSFTNLVRGTDYTIKWTGDGKSIGKQSFTIIFAGKYIKNKSYTGSFNIVPGKARIKSVKAAKKKATVKCGALSGGVKYQIAYRISGGWKYKTAAKTSLTIKKLKSKKKYTFKVRAFKVVGGKKYWGEWSKTKKVKIK